MVGIVHFSHKSFDALTLMELHDLLWLRNEVFVFYQKITAESEIDGRDPDAVHILGRDAAGKMVATARLFMDGDVVKVGRVAVHQDLHRGGVGTALMRYAHDVIGSRPAALSAQAYLQDWYHRLGWQPVGDIYEEAEIPHIYMVRDTVARSGVCAVSTDGWDHATTRSIASPR